ncbi:cellulose biosynthesis protein BcsG [Pseudomonas paeninsulae]|uniref:cellulose biosynthesis protein BcsG n=1 Tax=Pseudomonas paeninsulae TaxID=3110772 RepID=UPI002D77441F|nr:cellulose biosynthesis protein BcsG [Pseudomonas sp. IT1137]
MSSWRGLGVWNFYFITKLVLLWYGQLNFHALENLAFAAFLLLPLPPQWLHRLRHVLAIPLGVALYYYDSWLPPFSRLIASSAKVSQFSPDYMLELLGRFINPTWLAAGLILLVGYLFVSQWIRVTSFTVVALVLVLVVGNAQLFVPRQGAVPVLLTTPASIAPMAGDVVPAVIDDAFLNAALDDFYASQGQQVTQFPSELAADAVPVDVLMLNICSLAWDDLEESGMRQHPLWAKMDILFDDFNSAATYSGPAVLRLLRASCGQTSNAALYRPAAKQCFLFENLKQLGYTDGFLLNHTGHFDNLLGLLRDGGRLQAVANPLGELRPALTGFDGWPIYRDQEVLTRWWQQRLSSGSPREALFYNSSTLHDGNRRVDKATGKAVSADYTTSLRQVLDDLDSFIEHLQASAKPVLLVIVAEHGAALRGDLMQVKGMREIPSPTVTHIPAGLKLINAKAQLPQQSLHIQAPSSYQALSELIARLVDGEAYRNADFDLLSVTHDLPQLDVVVAENEGSVMVRLHNEHYLRMENQSWIPYPQH